MKTKLTSALVTGALALGGAGAALGQDRYVDEYSFRIARAPDWNLAAADGGCRLRLYEDRRRRIEMLVD